jgi:enterochelin esterase family protein
VYTGAIPLPQILDSLTLARAVTPSVAVMIDNASGADRIADLGNRAAFASFLADELVPWVAARYRVTRSPMRTIVTGSSAGGLAAAYVAFRRPDVFGNVLSQSGAFWRGNEGTNAAPFEWLTEQYSSSAAKPIHFFLDVGSTESIGAMGGTAPSILQANRNLRDVLKARGYAVDYYEVPGGEHDPSTWRVRLPVGLARLASP